MVNAQELKVSFLKHDEAVKLITEPTPPFRAQEIFGDGVVEEIIRLTNCQPYLIQAVCSKLLDALIDENRSRAELGDVTNAANDAIDSFDAYFSDLWNRCKEQQLEPYLLALTRLDNPDFADILQYTNQDKDSVERALTQLQARDLILETQDTYAISIPLIKMWIAANKKQYAVPSS